MMSVAERFGDLVGTALPMRELFAELQRLAGSQLSVLIEGETGTGKDLVAQSIHRQSARSGGPFVVFDCGSVAPRLIESELFGHERGAFTGATTTRLGVFEEARGGTLFLDEIGELAKELQPKLLRVLEKRELERLGAQGVEPVDVRVLAATNRDLAAEVRAGNFRKDLYDRLAGARVAVPPLRERGEDIPLLIEHFLSATGTALHDLSPEAVRTLCAYAWPGNVRELRNAVECMVVSPELTLQPREHIAQEPSSSAQGKTFEPLRSARQRASDAFERRYVRALLEHTRGNVTLAAATAEVSRQMIQKLMRKHGISSRAIYRSLRPAHSTQLTPQSQSSAAAVTGLASLSP